MSVPSRNAVAVRKTVSIRSRQTRVYGGTIFLEREKATGGGGGKGLFVCLKTQ